MLPNCWHSSGIVTQLQAVARKRPSSASRVAGFAAYPIFWSLGLYLGDGGYQMVKM